MKPTVTITIRQPGPTSKLSWCAVTCRAQSCEGLRRGDLASGDPGIVVQELLRGMADAGCPHVREHLQPFPSDPSAGTPTAGRGGPAHAAPGMGPEATGGPVPGAAPTRRA